MHNDLRDALTKKLKLIDKELLDTLDMQVIPERNISLASGYGGICLYFMTRYQQTGKEHYYDAATNLIDHVVKVTANYPNATFCAGSSGIGWLIQYGFNIGFFDGDANEILADYDNYFMQEMNANFEKGLYDFFHGGLGFGLYFLRRTSLKNHHVIIRSIVDNIERNAIVDDSFAKWYHYDFERNEQLPGVYNLGLAHGIPAIITFLTMVGEAGFERERVAVLIRRASNFLLTLQLPVKTTSMFPCFADSHKENFGSTCRLGWCYGDLSVAVCLFRAGIFLNAPILKEAAHNLIVHSIQRKFNDDTQIIDAGFCHGATGIMYIYNWFYRHTGITEYRDAAIFCAKESLRMARFEDGIQGFKSYTSSRGWTNDHGLLEGVAGIGLCYSSVLLHKHQTWSEWVLLT